MKKLLPLLFLSALTHLEAQDPFFSQTYSAPTLLNPALAGSTGAARFSSAARKLIYNSDFSWNSLFVSYDQMVNKINSGIGVYFVGEDITNTMKKKRCGLDYAVPVLLSNNLQLASALELSYQESKLVLQNDEALAPGMKKHISYLDFGAGLQLNSDRVNFGLACKHLNRANYSHDSIVRKLVPAIDIIGDYVFGRLDEKKAWKFTPGFRFIYRDNFFDMRFSLCAVYHKLRIGIAYINYLHDFGSNVASAQISYQGSIFKFRYSYDLSTQEITGSSSKISAHEVSTIINLFGKKKPEEFVPVQTYAF